MVSRFLIDLQTASSASTSEQSSPSGMNSLVFASFGGQCLGSSTPASWELEGQQHDEEAEHEETEGVGNEVNDNRTGQAETV